MQRFAPSVLCTTASSGPRPLRVLLHDARATSDTECARRPGASGPTWPHVSAAGTRQRSPKSDQSARSCRCVALSQAQLPTQRAEISDRSNGPGSLWSVGTFETRAWCWAAIWGAPSRGASGLNRAGGTSDGQWRSRMSAEEWRLLTDPNRRVIFCGRSSQFARVPISPALPLMHVPGGALPGARLASGGL
jgi:hypothetical protein